MQFSVRGKNDMRKDNTCKKGRQSNQKRIKKESKLPKHLEHINTKAAGIDVGSKSHFVAVLEGCAEVCVREFQRVSAGLWARNEFWRTTATAVNIPRNLASELLAKVAGRNNISGWNPPKFTGLTP